ncbi:family 16 glycosylhydrolase [bacterium]|nr:family 16 glycosylhydrolase [bacterium]
METLKTGTSIKAIAVALFLTVGFITPACATYSLVWSDEFDGASLNLGNWSADIGNGCPDLCGWGNNELEYYRAENVTVSGGNLVLTTLEEYYGGYSYTSGKVTSRDKQTFLYGRIEMRAKIPTGGGMWPAFWMMPQDDVYGGWAASGEIDIMEAANNTTSVGGTLHFGGSWPDNTSTGGSYSLGGANFADDFHIYSIEWEPDVMRWYVDGVLYSTKVSSQWYTNAAPGNPRAPFDQEFYIILNAAIGGNYTGCTDPGCITASLPQQFLIDYVRVYEDIENVAPTVTITSPSSGDNPPAGNITINATASDTDGSVITVEFYDGNTYLGEDTTAPYTFTWTAVADGCYAIIAKAVDDLGGFGTDTVDITVGTGCGQAPYLGSPFAFPVRIEAEDFDIGGEGIAYHDVYAGNTGAQYRLTEDVDIETCTDAGGGFNAGWILQDEWLEYTVSVPVAGEYTIETRVASLSVGGTFHLEFDGQDKTGDVSVPVTGGWQTWTTVSTTATLASGTQVMRFVTTLEGFNVNYFEVPDLPTAVLPDLQSARCVLHPCYPNPFNPTTTISYDLPEPKTVNLTIYDVAGERIQTLLAAESAEAGRHEVVWNGRDETGRVVAAGVYFCRLEAGEYSGMRRMVLVK